VIIRNAVMRAAQLSNVRLYPIRAAGILELAIPGHLYNQSYALCGLVIMYQIM
jgi:hypothetical protein